MGAHGEYFFRVDIPKLFVTETFSLGESVSTEKMQVKLFPNIFDTVRTFFEKNGLEKDLDEASQHIKNELSEVFGSRYGLSLETFTIIPKVYKDKSKAAKSL